MSDIEEIAKEVDLQGSTSYKQNMGAMDVNVEGLKEETEGNEEAVQAPHDSIVQIQTKTTPEDFTGLTQEEQNELLSEEHKLNLQISNITPPNLPSRNVPTVEPTEISSPKLPPRQTEKKDNFKHEAGLQPPPLASRRTSDAPNGNAKELLPMLGADMIQNRLFQMIRELKFDNKFKKGPNPDTIKSFANDDTVWGQMIREPVETLSNTDSNVIEEQLLQGVDAKYRAALWNSVSFSYCHNWETIYDALPHEISTESLAEMVQRELRDSVLVPEEKESEIYKILSAYMALDTDTVYDTSLIGIVMAIYGVYNDEVKTFSIFATLMKFYGYSKLYQEKNDELPVLLYQFDRLLEENCHDLYEYLAKKGIQSSMFTKMWFLTCFSSDLPLDCVRQLMDVVFLEGIDCLLKFSLSILLQNEEILLSLNFESLLTHMREKLFSVYLKSSGTEMGELVDPDKQDSLPPVSSENFNMKTFMEDALKGTRVTPGVLKRYYGEFVEIHRSERNQEKQFELVNSKNLELQAKVRSLEQDYTMLNREHVTIANELLQNQLKVENVKNENMDLKIEVLNMRRRLEQDIKENKEKLNVSLPGDMQKDIDKTLKKNAKVMQENSVLQDRVSELEALASKIRQATEQGILFEPESSSAKETLKAGWQGLRNVFKSGGGGDDRKVSL